MRVAVLGAAGTIAPAIVAELASNPEVTGLTLLDRDGERVREVAARRGNDDTQAAAVDATDRQALTLALEGHQVLVNAASYRVNLEAMDACLAADCSYLDLGGLFHVAKSQYRMHEAFAQRGLVAVLGCGAGPGKTNVMAAHAAAMLDSAHRVRCASAGLDPDPPAGLSVPYAIETLIDELTLEPVVLRDGEHVALDPLTPGGSVGFPDPIGARGTLHTLHSEPLTLGDSLGVRDCDFRLALEPAVHAALLELTGLSRAELRALKPAPASARTVSAQHVEVIGERDGEPAAVTVTALTVPDDEHGLGGGIVSTAAVAAATVRLFARGELRRVGFGVHPPERALRPDLLFAELALRGCAFTTTTTHVREVSQP